MPPWQRKLRRAFGSVKDQTTIGLAKVASTMAPELEVAVVKATSHYEAAMEEKHAQEVIFLTSMSRTYTMACVSLLSRRLGRTHNWIVVIKTLTLIHRLLRDGDPYFEEELFYESQAGSRILNLSGFRDDSVSNGWDYSAFVRSYALFLDELLDYNASKQAFVMEDGRPSGSSSSSTSRRSGSEAHWSTNEEHVLQNSRNLVFKEMKPCELLERMPPLQKLLERVLNCHPAGVIKLNRLVQITLELVIKDSFRFYDNITDGLAILLDAFFEMESGDCIKAFEIHIVAAKQAEALNLFYGFCKSIEVCHASDYPFVPKVPEKLLEVMEDFLKDRFIKGVSDEQERGKPLPEKEAGAASPGSLNPISIRPLLAPPDGQALSSRMQDSHGQNASLELSLLDLNDVTNTIQTERARPFDSAPLSDTNSGAGQEWQASDRRVTSQEDFKAFGEERTAASWELALFASLAHAHTPEPSRFALAGGLNCPFVDKFREQALYLQQRMAMINPFCSTSGMEFPGETTSLLALPAPDTPAREDPFVASTSIPPPPYVQMSDMEKQELLHKQQQQLLWMQCQRNGAHGHDRRYTNLMQTCHTNPDQY